MPSYHARLSPSSASRWTSCTASAQAQDGTPNTNSEASREGTCCHQVLAECLEFAKDPQDYLGYDLWFGEGEFRGEYWPHEWPHTAVPPDAVVTVTQEMVDAVASVKNFVLERAELLGAHLEIEQRVPIGHFTGEEGAGGTSDVVYITHDTIGVIDAKFGRHKVDAAETFIAAHRDLITGARVPAMIRPNLQLTCYALGALEKFGLLHDFKFVTLSIAQPFIGHVSDHTMSVGELLGWRDFLRDKAEATRTKPEFVPTPDNCHFCRASGQCDAQTEMVLTTAVAGFTDEGPTVAPVGDKTQLGDCYALIPLITDWCKAVTERVTQRLAEGTPVFRSDGLSYKQVAGKKAARTWTDKEAAEEALKTMRLKAHEMYVSTLISPTQAEKLALPKKAKKGEEPIKPPLGKKQWERLQNFIAPQGTTAPVVVLETDPRPALASATAGFEDVPPADNSDLF